VTPGSLLEATATSSTKPGLYIPRAMLERYTFEQAVVAAGLLHAYKTVMGNHGQEIVIPMVDLLDICGGPPETIEDLEIIIRALEQHQRVMHRIDDGVLTLWFHKEIAERIQSYEVVVTVTGALADQEGQAASA
jgi:hypothetical protein